MTVTVVSGEAAKVGLPRIPRISVGLPTGPTGPSLPAGLWVGDGPPGVIPDSKAGQNYLDSLTGDVYKLEADMATWTPVANVKGPAGSSSELTEEQLLLLASQLTADVESSLALDQLAEVPNLTNIFNAALAD